MTLFSRLCGINTRKLFNLNNVKVTINAFKTFTTQPKKWGPFINYACLSQVRNKSIFRFFKKPDAEQLKIKDNMPVEFNLIYRNTMNNYLLLAQVISTFCAACTALTAILYNDFDQYRIKFDSWKDQPKNINNEMYIYLFALVGICVTLQALVMKMPLRIYNFPKQNKYIFVFYGNLPFTMKQIVCKQHDIAKLAEAGILPWRESRYEIKDIRGIIMIDTFFRRPADLNIMLGYHKNTE